MNIEKEEAEEKSVEKEPRHWSGIKEAGTYNGFMFLLWVHKVFGRTIFGVVLYPVMVYFVLFRHIARRASLEFLQAHYRLKPEFWSKPPGYVDVFWHFIAFGQAVLDKLLAWTVNMSESEFKVVDREALSELLDDPRGQLIIGSHVGNLEYCRGFVQRYKNRTINILVYDQHAANFVKMMLRINAASRVHVYQVDQLDIPTMLMLKSKIEGGEWLFIAGDRIPLSGEKRTVPVNFMGKQAQMPIGPYMLAKTLQCPVKLMFSYRLGKQVLFDMVPFSEKVEIPRKGRDETLRVLAQNFASELEKQCLNAPMQWFNFYPYFDNPSERLSNE